MSLTKALGVERLLFKVYATAQMCRRSLASSVRQRQRIVMPSQAGGCERHKPERSTRVGSSRPRPFLTDYAASRATNGQKLPYFFKWSRRGRQGLGSAATRVTMPNLLNHTRLIGDKRYLQLVRSIGPSA